MAPTNPVTQAAAGANVRLFSLGRYALLAALRIARVAPGDKVLVPAFVCRDLLASIHAVQAEPLFYPVDRTLGPQLLPSAQGARAVLAVNYFGFPQELEPFRAYCAKHDATLIEDNAHGFLSCDAIGDPLGSRGDLGFVSLRKTIATPDGAALLLNRADWADRLPAPLPCRGDPLPAGFVAKRVLGGIQVATGVRVRSLAERTVRYARRLRGGRDFSSSLPDPETLIPGEPAIHCESVRILEKIDAEGEIERRRALYREFRRDLRSLNLEPVFEDLPPGVAPCGYAFRAGDSGAAAVARIARNVGFACSRWPDLPVAVAPDAPEFYRNVWLLNFLC